MGSSAMRSPSKRTLSTLNRAPSPAEDEVMPSSPTARPGRDLGVDEAAVVVVGGQGCAVALQQLLFQDAALGEPGEQSALLDGQLILQIVLGELARAFDDDLLDEKLLAFIDDEVEPGLALPGGLDLVGEWRCRSRP